MKISLVMPAYNEEKNIEKTLEFILMTPNIDEIIIVNDGSSDHTADICQKFKNIIFIDLEKNKGKTHAVLEGVRKAKSEHILLFDADLLGLKHEYIERLINKYQEGYEMVIMDYSGTDWVRHKVIQGITALSGVRILQKKYFDKIPFVETDSFELETRINEYFLKNKLSITVVEAETVLSPFKFQKYPVHVGLWREMKAMEQFMLMNGWTGLLT